MGLLEAVVKALLSICGIALCYFLIVWVLGAIGFSLPPHVLQILMVMLVLIAILILARLFYPWVSGPWFPPRP